MLRTLPLYLLALLALVGCRDELGLFDPTFDYGDAYFILDEARPMTRTEYYADDIDTTAFVEGNVLGVFAIDADGNAVEGEKANARYVVHEMTNISGVTVKVLRPADTGNTLSKGLRYLVYYPYKAGLKSVDQLKDYTHAVYTDQRGDRQARDLDFYDQNENFEQSDLLWDIASQDPADSRVHIVMDHAMAQFIVTMDDSHYKLDDGIDILNQPVKADHVNLIADGIDAMNQSYRYQVDSEYDHQRDIHMWNFEYSRTGSRQFRAVLPACRTLAAGTEIFGATNRQGNHVTLRLKRDLTLRPGYNYRFDLNRKPTPLPEIGDDVSWVLDVLDPETGAPVGLLCREYIRYQPRTALSSNPADNWLPDQITHPNAGREVLTVTQGEGTGVSYPTMGTLDGLSISSQCWVFYNLQADNRTPDLSHGTIMRFIYDYRASVSNPTDSRQAVSAWPAPFISSYTTVDAQSGGEQGIFACNHGHDWIYDASQQCGRSTDVRDYPEHKNAHSREKNYYYEFCSNDATDLGMHGGKIVWDGAHNRISSFTMPAEADRVSNETAYNYGHISIPQEAGQLPYVSYTPVTGIYDDDVMTNDDTKRHKAGIVVPHYLVDFRGEGENTEVNRYPLVKIGFNQFWMSKSLRTRKYVNGAPITCYNDAGNVFGLNNYNSTRWEGELGPGFLYPSYVDDQNNIRWSPWEGGSANEARSTGTGLNYNHKVLDTGRFVAVSPDPTLFDYFLPTTTQFRSLTEYLGWAFTIKLTSSKCDRNHEAYDSDLDAVKDGAYVRSSQFCPNVSGFNLRADGFKSITDSHDKMGASASLLLKGDETNLRESTQMTEQIQNGYDTITVHVDDSTDMQQIVPHYDEHIYYVNSYYLPALVIADYNRWYGGGDLDELFDRDIRSDSYSSIGKQSHLFAPVRFCMSYQRQNTNVTPVRRKTDGTAHRSRTVRVAVE